MTRRYLFVRLPFFAVQRHLNQQAKTSQRARPWWDADVDCAETSDPVGPLVLVTHGTHGTRLSAVGPNGLEQGFWPGMKLNDARAMMPQLRVETHDMAADRALQKRLGHWLLRYSPRVALSGDDGFVLDVAGCVHLFGGEATMAKDIHSRFKTMGFDSRLAFADTAGAALALVFHGGDVISILPSGRPTGHQNAALDDLPVEALRLDDETLVTLKRLGLKRVGDVRVLPRAALERRFRDSAKTRIRSQAAGFAQSVQWRLDQLAGAVPEPLRYIREPQEFRAIKQCPDLALEMGAVEIALDELLPSLCKQLQDAGMGARGFCLTGYRADGGRSTVTAELAQPMRDPPVIARLFRGRLDQVDCGFGVDQFILEAMRVEALEQAQDDALAADNADFKSASIAGFADIIANRNTGSQVLCPMPRFSHVPERAQWLAPVDQAVDWKGWEAAQPVWSPRPLRLFVRPEPALVTAELPDSPPLQFIWRKRLRKIIRACGPERILPEWWHDELKAKPSAVFRDYYDVEDETGLRYWIYRTMRHEPVASSEETQRVTRWFIHGLF